MSRCARHALVTVIALAALLVAAELGLRTVGGAYLELLRKPPTTFAPGAQVKILAIGDSFTFGIGAGGPESYPDQLAALLDARFGDGVCQVINWGLPAQNSSEALFALDAALRDGLRPDFVLVAIGINNYWNWHLASHFLPGDAPLHRVRAALGGLRLWRLATVAVTGGPVAAGKLYARNDVTDSRDPWFARLRDSAPEWITTWLTADLRAIKALCEARGIGFVPVGYPLPSPMTRAAFEDVAANALAVDARFFGAADAQTAQAFVSADAWHPNAAGYAQVARLVEVRLAPAITKKLASQNP